VDDHLKSAYFLLGATSLMVVVALRSALRHAPWGGTYAVVWLVGIALLAAQVVNAVRTVRRVPTAPAAESQRAIYALTAVGFLFVSLALTLPDVLAK
jgi:hypothetical protein